MKPEEFGRLTVTGEAPRRAGRRYVVCQCSCPDATVKEIMYQSLSRGLTNSCGCLNRELLAKRERSKIKIEIGSVFGLLTVIEPAGVSKNGHKLWKCRCSCPDANEIIAFATNLRKENHTTSCGCEGKRISSATGRGRQKVKFGDRFGRLIVISHAVYERPGQPAKFMCRCDCDENGERDHLVTAVSLLLGHTGSCGCLATESRSESNKTHGMSRTRLHNTWKGMKQRCTNHSQNYTDYSGRGITLCTEWGNFEPFMEWALANGYQDDLEIDRKDNEGNYCPENCRWVDRVTNINNQRLLRKINTSGYRGACYCKRSKKWIANVRSKLLPRLHEFHDTVESAAKARDLHVIKHGAHLKGMPLNFPELAQP